MDVVEVEDCNSSEMTGPSKVGGQGVKVATFHQWKYSHYFVVVDESEKNMRARCTLCSPSSKPLSCARNITSNFKKHLDTVHKLTFGIVCSELFLV